MKITRDISDVSKEITLQGGDRIILVNRMGKRDWPKEEDATNIFRLNANGDIVWRVNSEFDSFGDPFMNIKIQDGKITASRWDSFWYEIDSITGRAVRGRYSSSAPNYETLRYE